MNSCVHEICSALMTVEKVLASVDPFNVVGMAMMTGMSSIFERGQMVPLWPH